MRITHIQIFVAEQDLAFYKNVGMHLPGCRGALTGLGVAQREGWTIKRTNAGALLDVIALRRATEDNYEPLDATVRSFVVEGDEAATKREQAKLRKALRVGDRLKVALAEAEVTQVPVEWSGV